MYSPDDEEPVFEKSRQMDTRDDTNQFLIFDMMSIQQILIY